jgi:EpsI family protein
MNRVSWRAAFTILLLTSTIAAARYGDGRRTDSLAAPLTTIDSGLAGWLGIDDPPLASGTLAQLKPTSYLSRTYSRAGERLGLFIAYYDQQRSGETMHSPKHCLPANGWEIWKIDSAEVPVNGQPVTINRYSVKHVSEKAVVLYWYQSRERMIASEYLGKLLLVRDALVDGRTGGSIVRVTVVDTPEAVEHGLQFVSALIPQVQRCWGR